MQLCWISWYRDFSWVFHLFFLSLYMVSIIFRELIEKLFHATLIWTLFWVWFLSKHWLKSSFPWPQYNVISCCCYGQPVFPHCLSCCDWELSGVLSFWLILSQVQSPAFAFELDFACISLLLMVCIRDNEDY
jgi:hypothetical protein